MGEFLGKVADEILSLFKRNYKRPKLWIGIILIFVVFILLIPYIDANLFYFNRMEKRINILNQIMEIDMEKVKNNETFAREYQSLLNEIEKNEDRSLNSIVNKMNNFMNGMWGQKSSKGIPVIKFLTGAIWFILLLVWVPFMDTFQKKSDKLLAFIIILILGVIVGFIAMKIPVFITPMVNYIGIPLLQLVIVALLVLKSDKKDK